VFIEKVYEPPVKMVVVLVTRCSDEVEISAHEKGSIGSSHLGCDLEEGPGSPMIRRAINTNDRQNALGRPMQNGGTKIELAHIYHSHFKGTVTDAHEHAPGVPVSREPAPKELVADLQAAQFQVGEVLLDGFLKNHYINVVIAEVILQKGSSPPTTKPSNIPEEASHLETLP
jgi:hypothetical protein